MAEQIKLSRTLPIFASLILLLSALGSLPGRTEQAPAGKMTITLKIMHPSIFHYKIKPTLTFKMNARELDSIIDRRYVPKPVFVQNPVGELTIYTYAMDRAQHNSQGRILAAYLKKNYPPGDEKSREFLPVTVGQLATTKKVITEQLDALKKGEPFDFSLKQKPPDALVVQFQGVNTKKLRDILISRVIPARGVIEFRCLPKNYLAEKKPGNKNDNGKNQYIFKERKKHSQISEKDAIKRSKLVLTAEDIELFPSLIMISNKLSSMYGLVKLKPKAIKPFAKFTQENIGSFLLIVIDDRVRMVVEIREMIPDGRIAISDNSPEEEKVRSLGHLFNALQERPLPLPVYAKVNGEIISSY